ncbi:hypothetical protein ACFFUB_04945 [Algimonas porphyrae]|uniref:Uncharacterized protein n=1 Tax=Algimonas porphyrae TaxID=1128113 RepID=A0ABQ5UX42_9PROT|nr:hypothetical protein [Algimonas porphyrae]GLQ19878.1 hypothetical protein GCM10007854_08330 [Algimonas porphyrae]
MSPESLSNRWLSLRCWLLRSVLPAASALLAMLLLLRVISPDPVTLDHTAVMVGFAALYFSLFRGCHILMIRSLHADMMRRHPDAYRAKLLALADGTLRRRNLGFTLARVKRDILVEAKAETDRKRRDLFPR